MGRFRKRSRRSYARSPRSFRRAGRRGKNGGGGFNVMKLVGAAAYGGLREKASTMLAPISAKLPFGEYADEVTMIGAAWALGKFVPMTRIVTEPAMLIEASRIGATLAGNLGGSTAQAVSAVRYG